MQKEIYQSTVPGKASWLKALMNARCEKSEHHCIGERKKTKENAQFNRRK